MRITQRAPMWLAAFIMVLLLAPGDATAQQDGGTDRPQTETLKERLGSKASDPQRVNDCKVQPEERGDSMRPADCDHIKLQPDQPSTEQ